MPAGILGSSASLDPDYDSSDEIDDDDDFDRVLEAEAELANMLFRDYNNDQIYRSLSEIESLRQRGRLGLCFGRLVWLFLLKY